MTKSELFRKAHAVVRAVIKAGDSYRATFAAALRGLISGVIVVGNPHEARNGKTYVEVEVGVKVGAKVFKSLATGAERFKKKAKLNVAEAFVVAGLGKAFDTCAGVVVRAYAA